MALNKCIITIVKNDDDTIAVGFQAPALIKVTMDERRMSVVSPDT